MRCVCVDAGSQVPRQRFCQLAGRVGGRRWWWSGPCLPCGWTLLLPLPAREPGTHPGGPHPRHALHRLHARLLRLLLQDLDRCLRLLRQGCKYKYLWSCLECITTCKRELWKQT